MNYVLKYSKNFTLYTRKKTTFNQKNVKKYESRLIILRSRRKKQLEKTLNDGISPMRQYYIDILLIKSKIKLKCRIIM